MADNGVEYESADDWHDHVEETNEERLESGEPWISGACLERHEESYSNTTRVQYLKIIFSRSTAGHVTFGQFWL